MTLRHSIFSIMLLIMLVLGGAFTSALAQDNATLDVIPITSGGFVHVTLSPDGNVLALHENAIFIDNEVFDELLPITIVDLSSDVPIQTQLIGHTDYASTVIFNADASKLISLHTNGDLNVWDVGSATLERTIVTPMLTRAATPMALLSDDVTVVVNGAGFGFPQLLLWDTTTGYMTRVLAQRFDTFIEADEVRSSGPPNSLAAYDVSDVDDRVVGIMANTDVWLWDAHSGEGVLAFETFDDPRFNVRHVLFSNDGSRFLFHNRDDEQLHVWDVNRVDEVATLPINTSLFDFLADDRLVWLNEDGLSFSMTMLDAPKNVTTTAISDLDALSAIDYDNVSVTHFAQMNLGLFAVAANRIVIGGIVNEADNTNFIAVVTLRT